MTGHYHIHSHQSHLAWDNSIPPVHRIESGETVSFECVDASNGQIQADSTVQAIRDFQMDRLDQVNGPVFVSGAEPGDVLECEFLEVETGSWGWTGIIPGFGLLSEDFSEPSLKIWTIDRVSKTAKFNDDITIRTDRPFTGEAGVARGLDGAFSTIPPYRTGGNLDCRHLPAGSKLFLPIEVAGALFSLGDGHAAQGDGEVCGTAIETSLRVTVRLTVHKKAATAAAAAAASKIRDIEAPEVLHPRALPNSERGYYIVTGVEDSLLQATKSAVRGMIRHLGLNYGLSRQDAYMLCSVAVELKIACCVDMPNYVVGAYLPLDIFNA